jgi:hypothetical protein
VFFNFARCRVCWWVCTLTLLGLRDFPKIRSVAGIVVVVVVVILVFGFCWLLWLCEPFPLIYFLGHCVWCKWLLSTCTNCVDKKRVANQRNVATVPPVPQDFLTIVQVEICLMKTNLKQPHYCKGNLHKENKWSRNMTVISMSVVSSQFWRMLLVSNGSEFVQTRLFPMSKL